MYLDYKLFDNILGSKNALIFYFIIFSDMKVNQVDNLGGHKTKLSTHMLNMHYIKL